MAAPIILVNTGWRIDYFSCPNFEGELGTDFSTFEATTAALGQVLPAVNTRHSRVRARDDVRERAHGSPDSSS